MTDINVSYIKKAQFRDQLSKYPQSGITSNNCEYCLIYDKNSIKEVPAHCLFFCPKVQGIFDHVITSLKLEHLIPLPVTPKCTFLSDENTKAQNLSNAIWTIIVNEILKNCSSLENIYFDRVTKIVKGEVIASCNAYSNKNLSREIGIFGLLEFLASQPVTGF